jgi:hypothetical protein
MGRLSKIEQTVNDTISHYGHVKIFPRGLPRFVDSLLRGTIRFGKRSGNTISLLNPDNTYFFETPPQTRDDKFVLKNVNKWIIEDCILSFGPERELHQVHDVIDQTVLLKTNLTQTYTSDDKVLLHSFPMLVSVDTNVGDTVVTVKTHYDIANGDVLVYLQDEKLLQSLSEIKIIKATKLGSVGDMYFNYLYSLELEKPITKQIVSNALVYMRAYPAYFSAPVRVPNALFTSEPIGPFLIDILSGRLTEGQEFKETFSIRTLNRSNNYNLGTSTSYVVVDKNYLILDRSIPVHAPMFWDLAEGSMRMTPSRIVLKVNNTLSYDNTGLIDFHYNPLNGRVTYAGAANLSNVDIGNLFRDGNGYEYNVIDVNVTYNYITILNFSGEIPTSISTSVINHLDGAIRKVTENKFCAGIKCVPNLSPNHSWRISLLSNEDCSIRFIFHPNEPQEVSLLSGIPKSTTVTIPADSEPITDIEINVTSQANICEVRMNEWSPTKDTVEQIEYSFVVHAIGTGVYQASGLIIKPYFMGSEFLKTSYDINSTYDSGKLYF